MHTDPISTELKKTQGSLYLDEGIFIAKHLLDTESEVCKAKLLKKSNTMSVNNFVPQKLVSGYEDLLGDELVESILEEGVSDKTKMNSFTKIARGKGHNKTANQDSEKKTIDKADKQTVELKIDLKVTEESSPDNQSSDARKSQPSLQSSEKDILKVDKDSLRLDGVGGNDETTLEDLKSLIQSNKTMDESLKSKVCLSFFCFIFNSFSQGAIEYFVRKMRQYLLYYMRIIRWYCRTSLLHEKAETFFSLSYAFYGGA